MGQCEVIVLMILAFARISQGNFYDDLREAEHKINTQGCSAQQGDDDLEDFDVLAKDLQSAVDDLTGILGSASNIFGGSTKKDCVYECPDEKKPVKNPKHKPTYNGCGTSNLGVEVKDIFQPAFTKCCNGHDKCYDTCLSNRKKCDDTFGVCLKDSCSDLEDDDPELLEECLMMGELLHKGVDVLGCQAYLDSQKQACICK